MVLILKRKRIVWLIALACVAVGLTACAPQPNEGSRAEGGRDAGSAIVDFEWSSDADCSICHVSEQDSAEDALCLASQHKEEVCTSCHLSDLSSVHEGVSASDTVPKRLKKTEVSDDTCLACHYETKEALVAETSDLVLTDKEGNVANPHILSPNEDHDGIACADCHNMHEAIPAADQAMETCIGCHHEEVFECGTCHA